MTATRLVGIAGPSGSGKSELARLVAEAMDAPVISLDSYYLDLSNLTVAERALVNFDEPASMDTELLLSQCRALARGESIDVPHYDFARHTRAGETKHLEPGPVVILEGLFTLYWEELRDLLDASIYVDLEDEICYARRLGRDVAERGRTPECVERQYMNTVRPMAERYIWPTRRHADLVLRGDAELEDSVAAALALLGREVSSPAVRGADPR